MKLSMKTKRLAMALAASLALLIGLSACDSNDEPGGDDFNIELTAEGQVVVEQANDFAFNLMRQINEGEKNNNVLLSPYSAATLLSMLANGAAGDTRDQMLQALGHANLDQLNSYYAKLTRSFSGSNTFMTANSLWSSKNISMKSQYVNDLKNYYQAPHFSIDFSTATKRINKRINDNTKGMIPEAIHADLTNHCVCLVNAAYFASKWNTKFDQKDTKEENFIGINAWEKVQMMHNEQFVSRYDDDDLTVATIPYQNHAYNLIILLPEKSVDINQFVNELTSEKLSYWLSNQVTEKVRVGLPYWKMDYRIDLIPTLKQMGITDAFSMLKANFTPSTDAQWCVKLCEQNILIKVDEEGTVAAVETHAVGGFTSPGPTSPIIVNRPFVYLITENSTGTILFAGKIVTMRDLQ